MHRSSQSHRVLKSQPRESAAPRYIERASASDANIYPAPPPSAALLPRTGYGPPTRHGPPEPVVYLAMDMEIEVLKASPTFLELIGTPWMTGHSLYAIMDDADKQRVRGYLKQLMEERARVDPRYLPPLFNKEDSELAVEGVGFGAEDVSQFRLDRYCHITFTDRDKQPRPFSVQYGMAKIGSTYVVVMKLNVPPPQHPYPSPSYPRESAGVYAYPPQPPQPQQHQHQHPHQHQQYHAYAQRTPVSATFDPSRPRFDHTPGVPTDPTGRPLTAPPPGRPLLSGLSPGVSPGIPAYSPSPSRPDYGPGPSSYQIPRSELLPTSRAPPPLSFQLPPIRTQPQMESYTDDSLRPITIKQVLDAEETHPGAPDFRIDGSLVTQVTFVAQIRSMNRQETNIQYKLDDGTAVIEVKKYVDSDRTEAPSDPAIDVGGYVRCYGRLRAFNGKRYVSVHFIRAVTNYDEVNYHLLEAAAVHLYFTKGPAAKGAAAGGGGGDGMFVDSGAGGYHDGAGAAHGGGAASGGAGVAKLGNVSPAAQRLFNHMLNAPGGNEGVHLQVLSSGSGMSAREVLSAADELLGQGVIYPTVDDETWAVLEY
ncbi:uncharacterized protein DNG_02443 [Cephalotrichum gorgonifer]|uniref:Replication protein A C-terminal domain-containing protein n=1 Tax=Cephalotrichum gorgonifer TaxID=2041049 RepID=A0AAE8SSL8_9PEZI|nr:uncharacterized protein DNG_02443 [Cephalotrichum gorgonifer]